MKDIKEIIHLYIGQEVWETFNNRKAKLVGVIQGDNMPVKCLWHDKSNWEFYYDEVKLILRRLSSMDEHNKEELFDHIWPVGLWGIAWAGKMEVVEHILGVSEVFSDLGERVQQFMSIQDHAEMVDWLRSKGFWVGDNSAFDQGIIIDRDSQLN